MSARAELTLRQRLSQREERISELKDALAAAQHSPRQQTASQHRSCSPSPSAHVPDHAAYHSSAHHHNTTSHSHATHDTHHGVRSSRGNSHLGSQRHHSSPTAEHSSPQNSPEQARCDDQHVPHIHQQQLQHVDAASMHTARLPYFQPKSLKTDAQTSSASVSADSDRRPGQAASASKQGEMPRTLTGKYSSVGFVLSAHVLAVTPCETSGLVMDTKHAHSHDSNHCKHGEVAQELGS